MSENQTPNNPRPQERETDEIPAASPQPGQAQNGQRLTITEAVAMLKGFTPEQMAMILVEAVHTYNPPPPPPKKLTIDEWAARLESIPPGDSEALAAAVAEMHRQHEWERQHPKMPTLPRYAESLDAADSVALMILGEMAKWGYLRYGDIEDDAYGLVGLMAETIREGVTEGNLAEFARYANGQDEDEDD